MQTDFDRQPGNRAQEGDTNLSVRRQEFRDQHLSAETRAMLEQDERYFVHQSLSTPCLNVLDAAHGSCLLDHQQRPILDFHGNSVHQIGHAHPEVVQAVKDQLDALAFCPRRYTNAKSIELARRLSDMAPIGHSGVPPRVLFAPGGAAANGIALKMVRQATGRFKTISMWGSFHGASLDTISIGGEAMFRSNVGPLLPGCMHVPPYESEGVGQHSAEMIDYVLQNEADVAAVIAEPMRWTTVVPPPPEYWQKIRASCDRHGALLVIDEIPACLGRTGKMFCIEHFGVEPDVLVIGKGLGGGVFPLAAVIVRGDLNFDAAQSLGHFTHEKSPVGAAAALATLDVIDRQQLVERSRTLGQKTLQRLTSLSERIPLIREVRGLGLQIGVELGRDGRKAADDADRILYDCLRQGLSFKVSGESVLTLSPPLTISDAEMDRAITILETAMMTPP
jgi:4-aminobutyrate aminotransferase